MQLTCASLHCLFIDYSYDRGPRGGCVVLATLQNFPSSQSISVLYKDVTKGRKDKFCKHTGSGWREDELLQIIDS